MTDRQIVIRLFVLLVLAMLCGCAHLRCGPCEYWRLGKQEITYLHGRSEPNCIEFILVKQKGGEHIKPNLKEFVGE